jgi:hypothetical protein
MSGIHRNTQQLFSIVIIWLYVSADCTAGILSPKYTELEELEATPISVFAAAVPLPVLKAS